MRNPKASSAGVLWRDAFRMIKICVMGISMASVPLFVKPAFMGTYGFLSMAIPRVRETLSAWLTPAFLYVILNCIIIAIVANSGVGIFNIRGASSNHHAEDCSPSPHEQEKEEEPNTEPKLIVSEYDVVSEYKKEPKLIGSEYDEKEPKLIVSEYKKEPKLIVSEYNKKSCMVEKGSETTSMPREMITSAAFAAAETLEDTWKSITEARRPPPARQLRKSDTWETHRARAHPPAPESASLVTFSKFGKSETWNSGRNLDRQTVGAEMLLKEPSLGQDELNERVEAFIAKVNHDMKLQREQSLIHYMEMVNRGSG